MILREQGTQLNNNSFQTKSQNNTGQNQPITKTNTNIAAGSNGGFLQRLRTREKCIFCTICHCIEKSMLQTYQWDIQFEMQYCQDPQGPWLQAKG